MSAGLYSGTSGLALGVGLYAGNPGLWGGGAGLDAGLSASLYLDFLAGAPLDSRITFTRGTTATFVGSNGLIQSASINTPRFDYDPVTLAPKGLLIEEQRTNLLTASEDFAGWSASSVTVAANTTVAPDGQISADTLTASATSGYVARNAAFTGDGDKSYSLFVKAGTSTITRLVLRDTTVSANRGSVDITWTAGVPSGVAGLGTLQGIDNFGNGWYRIRMLATGVVAANINQFRFSPDVSAGTGTAIFWGAQTENGAFATSYIPTVASTVTRSADVALMQGSNFSSWYNQNEGTFVVEFDVLGFVANQRVFEAGDGTGANFIGWYSASGSHRLRVTNAAATTTAIGLNSPPAAGVIYKEALAFQTGNCAISVDAATVATLGSTIPTGLNKLNIGSATSTNGNQLNGHIRRIAYYPQRLPNATLQGITA